MTTQNPQNPQTEERRPLAFGLNEEIPPYATAYWGARWIFPDDFLSDRQDFVGIDTPEGQKLKEWLNGEKGKPGALSKSLKAARENRTMRREMAELVVLFEDETGVVLGNPRMSHGYLYVCAFLKQVEPQ